LSTEDGGQPYSNLVAFAEADHLRSLLFVTDRNTRKYTNARLNNRVAVLVDSRTNQASDLKTAVAITALGTIREVTGSDKDLFSEIYIVKHRQLADFLNKPMHALMEIVVTGYIVASFEGAKYLSRDEIS